MAVIIVFTVCIPHIGRSISRFILKRRKILEILGKEVEKKVFPSTHFVENMHVVSNEIFFFYIPQLSSRTWPVCHWAQAINKVQGFAASR